MQYINSSNVDTYSKYIQSGDLTPDKFLMFQDPSANELTKMKRLQILQEKTYTTDAEKTEMTQLLEDLREFMPTSEDWNKLCCGIYSVQVFLRDGIVMFVQQKKDEFNEIVNNFKYINVYDLTYKYKKGNMVTFEGEGYTCKKDSVGIEPNPLKTTEYWTKYTIKGDKGDPSLNIYYRGEYDATKVYNLKNGDACTVDGTLYYAKADNIVGLYPPYYADSWANFANSAIYINTVLPSVGTRNKGTLYFLQTDSNNLEKGILQDYLGNIIKPQTDASNVTYGSSTVKDTLDILTSNQTPYIKTTNSGNNYSVTIPNLTDLTDGYSLMVKFNATSTGVITLNPNNKGLINVVDYYGNPVNNVRNNLIANLVYEKSSNSFILLGKGGGGNATADKLLEGYKATVDSGEITGIMRNNNNKTVDWCHHENITVQQHPTDVTQALITIPMAVLPEINDGYYGSGSKIQANIASLNANNIKVGVKVGRNDGSSENCITGTFTSDATAQPEHIISGYSAYVNGNKINGNIPNRGEAQYAGGFGEGGDYYAMNRIPYGYYPPSGNGWAPEIRVSKDTIRNTLGVSANKILAGQNIAGVQGNATVESMGGRRYSEGSVYANYDCKTGTINLPFTPRVVLMQLPDKLYVTSIWTNVIDPIRSCYAVNPDNYDSMYKTTSGKVNISVGTNCINWTITDWSAGESLKYYAWE